ncbi:AfsA-related hotdog domain-containing protein [Microbacterium lacticum]
MGEQRVTKELVHKVHETGVALAAAERITSSTFRILIHPRMREVISGRRRDPVAGLEVMRQIGLLLGHHAGSVPLGWAFLLQELAYTSIARAIENPGRSEEVWAVAEIEATEVRQGRTVGMRANVDFHQSGQYTSRGSGSFRCVPPETYRALRRHAPVRSIGSAVQTDATLLDTHVTPSGLTAKLGWPTGNRLLFDHDVDHVPGMLLAQAGVSAHEKISSVPPRSLSLKCHSFAEIGEPILVSACRQKDAVLANFKQNDRDIATVETV